jgi:CubicO group peptidase (beta-lactamase class C family)
MDKSLQATLAPFVERGEVNEIVAGVIRADQEPEVVAIGAPRDAIFRISSTTKPFTAVATLAEVEAGTFALDDSVVKWLPELASPRVLKHANGPLEDTVPAHHPITVRHLLTFTCGIGMSEDFGPTPLNQREKALELRTWAPPVPATTLAPDEWMRRLGSLPLRAHPGETWLYNSGAQILGVLLARATGSTFEAVLRKRVFEPLGLFDTALVVAPAQAARLVRSLQDPTSQWLRDPVFPDGAAGLCSTVDDLLVFGRMLAQRGTHAGRQVLSKEMIDQLATDQLDYTQRGGATELFLGDRGWSLGMAVDGMRIGWDGGFGSTFAVDLASGLVGVALTQRFWDSPKLPPILRAFWDCANQ